jgi:hypothetical protein
VKKLAGASFIVGGGTFGTRAVAHLKEQGPVVVVDPLPTDGLAFSATPIELDQFLDNFEQEDLGHQVYHVRGSILEVWTILEKCSIRWLVPCAPVHVALELVQFACMNRGDDSFLGLLSPLAVNTNPEDLEWPANLGHQAGRDKSLYLSYGAQGFTCPTDCAGPAGHCPHQDLPKPVSVGDFVHQVWGQDPATIILSSEQIAPGLGAIDATNLVNEIHRFCDEIEPGEFFVVATVCNCHGVVSARRLLADESI